MNSCKNLESISSSISGLKSLKRLDVSDCSELKNIPENLGEVESLEEFDASGTSIRQPPASFFLLKNLKVLSFNGCKKNSCESHGSSIAFFIWSVFFRRTGFTRL
jgi:Leucine-rich repeat (LRR) protein